MNKNFILMDKTNSTQKGANTIIKFTLEEKDYLIYSTDENEQNKQIFVSKLILNSEGKYFIDNISPEEKNRLSNIVYNIIILTPSNAKKGSEPAVLIKDLTEKFNIKFSTEIPDLAEQEYYTNCSIAITGKEFVEEAIKFYSENIAIEKAPTEEVNATPTWEIPTMDTPTPEPVVAPTEMQPIPDIASVPTPAVPEPLPAAEPVNIVPAEPTPIQTVNVVPTEPTSAPVPTPEPVQSVQTPDAPAQVAPTTPNPQTAVMSDPSLGINNNMQPNVAKKNGGFAINKYIVIGTVCILIAIAVVVVAYILITKKTSGL